MTTLRTTPPNSQPTRQDRFTRWLKPRLMAQLDAFQGGRITLIEGSQCHHLGQEGPYRSP